MIDNDQHTYTQLELELIPPRIVTLINRLNHKEFIFRHEDDRTWIQPTAPHEIDLNDVSFCWTLMSLDAGGEHRPQMQLEMNSGYVYHLFRTGYIKVKDQLDRERPPFEPIKAGDPVLEAHLDQKERGQL